MPGKPDPLYVRARAALLDAADAWLSISTRLYWWAHRPEAAARQLAQAEAAIAFGGAANNRVAVEVIGNIAAMESPDRQSEFSSGQLRSA